MADLPTNLDATFVDDADNPGRKQHQQHHDSVHGAVNALLHAHAAAVAGGFVGDLETWLRSLDDVLDHGALTGLADDDHPQYLLHTEGDAAYLAKSGKAADSDLLDGLDSLAFALDSQGVLSGRPAAGRAGRYYFATDRNVVFRDDGAAWREVNPAAGARVGFVGAAESTTSTAFTDLATLGPSVTIEVGASGVVLIEVGCGMRNGGGESAMGFAASGANALGAAFDRVVGTPLASNDRKGRVFTLTGLARGATTVTAKYAVTANTGTFFDRRVAAVPL
jgi:hypothetical protein